MDLTHVNDLQVVYEQPATCNMSLSDLLFYSNKNSFAEYHKSIYVIKQLNLFLVILSSVVIHTQN